MARMSIDDSALRDPRVLRLAKRLGWSRRETIGALLDVWAISYDRATDTLPTEDVDIAGGVDNFAADMMVVGLGWPADAGIRLSGAAKRIKYLQDDHDDKVKAGAKGGVKSGEARREAAQKKREADSKQAGSASDSASQADRSNSDAASQFASFADGSVVKSLAITDEAESKRLLQETEAERTTTLNPSASVPVVVNPPVPDVPAPTRKRRPRFTKPEIPLPPDWRPTQEHIEFAAKHDIDIAYQEMRFRAHADTHDRRAVRWNGAFTSWLLQSSQNQQKSQSGLQYLLGEIRAGEGTP